MISFTVLQASILPQTIDSNNYITTVLHFHPGVAVIRGSEQNSRILKQKH